jgi:HD domain
LTPLPVEPIRSDTAEWAALTAYRDCPPHIVAHAERSFQFAALIAKNENIDIDLEVVYVGAILHDLGLRDHHTSNVRFEMRGANEVRTALLERGWSKDRAGNVWDVIALHASGAIAAHKSPETYVVNLGISIDIRGRGHEQLAPADIRAVLDAYPRTEFPAAMAATLSCEVIANPGSVRLSWLESVAEEAIPGYRTAPFLDALRASGSFL